MKVKRTWAALALLSAGVVLAPATYAAPGYLVVFDTIDALQLDWHWLSTGDSGTTTYTGTHWNAELSVAFAGGSWSITGKYLHLDGPHGETSESAWTHVASLSFAPGSGDGVFGTDDHVASTGHIAAHPWALTGNGPSDPAFGGFAYQQVAHVPEPAEWASFLAGLAVLGMTYRWRK